MFTKKKKRGRLLAISLRGVKDTHGKRASALDSRISLNRYLVTSTLPVKRQFVPISIHPCFRIGSLAYPASIRTRARSSGGHTQSAKHRRRCPRHEQLWLPSPAARNPLRTGIPRGTVRRRRIEGACKR